VSRVSDLVIRPYRDSDEDEVLPLLGASLGKTVDERYRRFFRWKHQENPFGRSFMWVGAVDGRIAGFRAFLRWRFISPDGETVEAVRAVDTATHPDFQGMGIFRTLTMNGLDEMREAGIQFVFNTPNDQSRPGYLKMGWEVEGRVPVGFRPRSLLALRRMIGARTAADNWSLPTSAGEPLGDLDLDELADPRPSAGSPRLVTDRSPAFLGWRYGACEAVSSRAIRIASGAALVRFRQRGSAVECTVGDVIGTVSHRQAGHAIRRAMREGGADYAIAGSVNDIGGMLRSSRLGPIQTRRQLSDGANRLPLSLTLGDVEMF